MKKITCFYIIILFLFSCNDYRKQISGEVKKLEQEVTKKFDKEKASKLLTTYSKFIEKFPEDTTCKSYMIKGTEVSILKEDPSNAIKFINMFLEKYPSDPRAPLMQFKKAIVSDLLVHDPIKAVSEYELFNSKYPNHPMRKDAENAILLIRDPEAFTRMLTAKDSVAVDTLVANGEINGTNH